jgi:mRNA interferase HigB
MFATLSAFNRNSCPQSSESAPAVVSAGTVEKQRRRFRALSRCRLVVSSARHLQLCHLPLQGDFCLCSRLGNMLHEAMRVIAKNRLVVFWEQNPNAKASLLHWYHVTSKAADWKSTNDVQKAFPHAKVLNAERVRFEIAHNTFRLIVAFNFRTQIAFIKFVGSHAEYNKVDALIQCRSFERGEHDGYPSYSQ